VRRWLKVAENFKLSARWLKASPEKTGGVGPVVNKHINRPSRGQAAGAISEEFVRMKMLVRELVAALVIRLSQSMW